MCVGGGGGGLQNELHRQLRRAKIVGPNSYGAMKEQKSSGFKQSTLLIEDRGL